MDRLQFNQIGAVRCSVHLNRSGQMVCRPVPLCRLIGVVGVSFGYAEHRDGNFALEAAARAAGRRARPTRNF